MNKIIVLLFIGLSFLSCNKDDSQNPAANNPFLTSPNVNLNLSLNLPQYNPLNFPGQSVVITNQGIKGIVIYNVNNDLYTAFEISDPNHSPSSCSRMTIEGTIATCPCPDENSYNIVTGQHSTNLTLYPMLQFRVERNGDTVHVFN